MYLLPQPITDDDVDRIATCVRVLAERSELMQEIFNNKCRQSLSIMLAAKIEEDKAAQEVGAQSPSPALPCISFTIFYRPTFMLGASNLISFFFLQMHIHAKGVDAHTPFLFIPASLHISFT